MDHDIRSLQMFVEGRLDAYDQRAADRHSETTTAINQLAVKVDLTNGRVRKAEVALAVLRFAVFTIGGALVVAGLQVIVARLAP